MWSDRSECWAAWLKKNAKGSIPDGVEELREKCFSWCESLSRVTFGESSSLKLIENWAFSESCVVEIHIPDGIERLLMDRSTGLPPLCRVMKLA